jgi:hypothetical protein
MEREEIDYSEDSRLRILFLIPRAGVGSFRQDSTGAGLSISSQNRLCESLSRVLPQKICGQIIQGVFVQSQAVFFFAPIFDLNGETGPVATHGKISGTCKPGDDCKKTARAS